VIKLRRFRAKDGELVVNADLIETVEATPDTVVTLTTGHKLIVEESVDEVIGRVIEFKRACHTPLSGGREQAD